jgi:hypothetical protein
MGVEMLRYQLRYRLVRPFNMQSRPIAVGSPPYAHSDG